MRVYLSINGLVNIISFNPDDLICKSRDKIFVTNWDVNYPLELPHVELMPPYCKYYCGWELWDGKFMEDSYPIVSSMATEGKKFIRRGEVIRGICKYTNDKEYKEWNEQLLRSVDIEEYHDSINNMSYE